MSVKVLSIGRPPYDAELIAKLGQLQPIYHPDSTLDSFEALKKEGIELLPLPSEIPDNAVLLQLPGTGSFEKLVQIGNRLLAPGGCPWDISQTHQTLKKYLIEEAYELCDAIDGQDQASFQEELGDVLLQPVMHAAMADRDGSFDIDLVCQGICEKLIRRHPHVFGNVHVQNEDEVLKNWDVIKRAEKDQSSHKSSILDGVPNSAPSLIQANEVSKRAARQGFEWPDLDSVWQKLDEEVAELKSAIMIEKQERQAEELGDLLFTIVNIARWLKIDPEEALKQMLTRFKLRFAWMERKTNSPLVELDPSEWDRLWNLAKKNI